MRKPPGKSLRTILRAPRFLYRHRLGWMLGHRFLLLRHTGRRTGSSYATVVEVLRYDTASRQAFVMSGWGRRADWFRNIEAAGKAAITVGRLTYEVQARVLDDQEATEVLADYETRNRWLRPIIRRVLSGLAGLKYDGSDQSRRSVVRELPIVAFMPLRG